MYENRNDTSGRRAHQRTNCAPSRMILVNEKREALVCNISLGGLCFHSAEVYDQGNEISVGNRLMRLYAKVLQCDSRRTTEASLNGDLNLPHEVHCQFISTRDQLQEQMFVGLVMEDESAWAAH